MCMAAYIFLKYVIYRKDPKKVDGDALPMNPLVLWPVGKTFFFVFHTFLGCFFGHRGHLTGLHGAWLHERPRPVPDVAGVANHLLRPPVHPLPQAETQGQ